MNKQYIKIDENGDKHYFSDAEMTIHHRKDGPAIEYASGTKVWYRNDKLHREDGPAVEWKSGSKEWYINNQKVSELGFKRWCARQAESRLVWSIFAFRN